jgi:hypothetical protein
MQSSANHRKMRLTEVAYVGVTKLWVLRHFVHS